MQRPPVEQDIVAEAERLRAANALGKSDMLVRLFDFLLARTLAGRAPKEVEIAQDVFGRALAGEGADDATVRVYVHRLRRKLADHYDLTAVAPGRRLTVPLGDYRLAFADVPAGDVPAGDPPADHPAAAPPMPATPATPGAGWSRRALLGAGGVGLLGVGVVAGRLTTADDPMAPVRTTALWRATAAADRATLIIVGDYYIFGEARGGVEVDRLVREFSINSRADLDGYLMAHPEMAGRYVGLDLSYAPVGAISALGALMPLVTDRGRRPAVLPASTITARMLRFFNLVYVGYLSGLGPLRDPLFGASRFRVGDSYDELVDQRADRRYRADWQPGRGGRSSQRDYAYLATFPGPNGNSVTIVAGMRDAALMQAAEIAVDPPQLEQLARSVGGAAAFEALYQVRSVANANLDGALIAAHPLDLAHQWEGGAGTPLRYPDDRRR